MSATATGNKRLRQIAILLSSVDSATARQLLLHLPTETARQVRALAGKLGTVSIEEKRRILADFQRTAAASPATPTSQTPTSNRAGAQSGSRQGEQGFHRGGVAPENSTHDAYDLSHPSESHVRDSASDTKWSNLSSQGLLKFLRGERPAVIAVVVSQLSPKLAVQVLQDLPGAVNREVLQRMAGLGEIDPDALSSIEEYLSERLEEYRKTVRSESENQRRIDALLAAAPTALREQWQAVLTGDDQPQSEDPSGSQSGAPSTKQQPLDSTEQESPAVLAALRVEDSFEPQHSFGEPESEATILPFPGQSHAEDIAATTPANPSYAEEGDSSLIRLEFETLLELPPEKLAVVLSEPDSQTVLLALAGATPSFTRRFYNMLRPEDAIALKGRLADIGAIHLRDIDLAQRQLIELAADLLPQAERHEAARHRQAA